MSLFIRQVSKLHLDRDRPAEVMITALLTGALLFLLADSIGRSLFYPAIIPAGILVSVVSVPAFLIAARLSRGRA